MWEGWKKHDDTGDSKCYELMIGSEIKVLLVTCIAKVNSEPPSWKVEVTAFAPSAGTYIDYEDTFPSLAKAETIAWKEAQAAVEARRYFL